MHDRYRQAVQPHFSPSVVRDHFEDPIRIAAAELIKGFRSAGRVELRAAFARRLPIQAILVACGLPPKPELRICQWYDSFEAALANFTLDPTVRLQARRDVAAFHELLQSAMRAAVGQGAFDLVAAVRTGRLGDRPIAGLRISAASSAHHRLVEWDSFGELRSRTPQGLHDLRAMLE
jgi:cytochrome P450